MENKKERDGVKEMPKVFKMDEYSWVCAMSKDDAITWYTNNTGLNEEELDVSECDLESTMYTEVLISDVTKRLEQMNVQGETISITRRYGSFFTEETFRKVIENMIDSSGYEAVTGEPFEICSTEW